MLLNIKKLIVILSDEYRTVNGLWRMSVMFILLVENDYSFMKIKS